MTQISAIQSQQPQPYTAQAQPSYNAVKIDINNPQVNVGSDYSQNPIQGPTQAPQIYSYPQAPIYEIPQQSIYQQPQPSVEQPSAAKEVPAVPQPVVIQQPAPAQTPVVAPTKPVEVKTPQVATPPVDVNAFLAKLNSADFEEQANAMESIADMAQTSPDKAKDLLDVKVIDTLLGIMQKDTSKLEGPTPEQLQIREKIMGGKTVTDAEKAQANKITPMEQGERNKQYSIYTVAILQKLYVSEIEKLSNSVVPITELPGASAVVEQAKNNPNPMVRASAVDALSYIQRPEYKQDLNTLFTISKNDKDANVQQAASKALEKLAQVADAAPAPVTKEATPAATAPAPTPAAEAVKPEEVKKA